MCHQRGFRKVADIVGLTVHQCLFPRQRGRQPRRFSVHTAGCLGTSILQRSSWKFLQLLPFSPCWKPVELQSVTGGLQQQQQQAHTQQEENIWRQETLLFPQTSLFRCQSHVLPAHNQSLSLDVIKGYTHKPICSLTIDKHTIWFLWLFLTESTITSQMRTLNKPLTRISRQLKNR